MRKGTFLFNEFHHDCTDLVGKKGSRKLMIVSCGDVLNDFAMFRDGILICSYLCSIEKDVGRRNDFDVIMVKNGAFVDHFFRSGQRIDLLRKRFAKGEIIDDVTRVQQI